MAYSVAITCLTITALMVDVTSLSSHPLVRRQPRIPQMHDRSEEEAKPHYVVESAQAEEETSDAESWRFGVPHVFASGVGSLPPKCAADASDQDPYWNEMVNVVADHIECKYRKPCDKKTSNLDRLNSIRGVLGKAKTLLDGLNIEYSIYAGSAIGQERCGDVLPWDADCDIVVWERDVEKISTGDLDHQYTVKQKSTFIPRAVEDKATGFYCDVFAMRHNSVTNEVEMPWPWGVSRCKDAYAYAGEQIHKCWRVPYDIVAPFVPCTLNGVQQTCMHNQLAFLQYMYGSGVGSPNVATKRKML